MIRLPQNNDDDDGDDDEGGRGKENWIVGCLLALYYFCRTNFIQNLYNGT